MRKNISKKIIHSFAVYLIFILLLPVFSSFLNAHYIISECIFGKLSFSSSSRFSICKSKGIFLRLCLHIRDVTLQTLTRSYWKCSRLLWMKDVTKQKVLLPFLIALHSDWESINGSPWRKKHTNGLSEMLKPQDKLI